MELIFDKIHEVVLETLEAQDKRPHILEVIGKWYFKFLTSNKEQLSLHIPTYNEEVLNLIY